MAWQTVVTVSLVKLHPGNSLASLHLVQPDTTPASTAETCMTAYSTDMQASQRHPGQQEHGVNTVDYVLRSAMAVPTLDPLRGLGK